MISTSITTETNCQTLDPLEYQHMMIQNDSIGCFFEAASYNGEKKLKDNFLKKRKDNKNDLSSLLHSFYLKNAGKNLDLFS